MVEPHAAAPQGVADLDVAAQFVLWAVRTRLEGAAARARLERGFELAQDAAWAARRVRRSKPGSMCWRRIAGAISICIAYPARA
jgi:hypothetical protein